MKLGSAKIADLTGVFEARATGVARCECGCGAFKLVFLDEQGHVRAMAGFTREQWVKTNRAMMILMLDVASDSCARPM